MLNENNCPGCVALEKRIARLERETNIDMCAEAQFADALAVKFKDAAYIGLKEWFTLAESNGNSLDDVEARALKKLRELYPTFDDFLAAMRRMFVDEKNRQRPDYAKYDQTDTRAALLQRITEIGKEAR